MWLAAFRYSRVALCDDDFCPETGAGSGAAMRGAAASNYSILILFSRMKSPHSRVSFCTSSVKSCGDFDGTTDSIWRARFSGVFVKTKLLVDMPHWPSDIFAHPVEGNLATVSRHRITGQLTGQL